MCLWQSQVWNSFRALTICEIIERWQTCVKKNPRKSQNCCRTVKRAIYTHTYTYPHIECPNEIGGNKKKKYVVFYTSSIAQRPEIVGRNRELHVPRLRAECMCIAVSTYSWKWTLYPNLNKSIPLFLYFFYPAIISYRFYLRTFLICLKLDYLYIFTSSCIIIF